MKRSEAISRIIEIHNRIYTVQMCDSFEENELADMFLERLEVELGLLPPKIDNTNYHIGKPMFINEWDKE